jgi:hypothetical protein
MDSMDDRVKVEIEVTPEAARALAEDDGRRRRIGDFVSRMVVPQAAGGDPLIALFHETQRAAVAAGLSEAEIDADLAAYNAEHRHRRKRRR